MMALSGGEVDVNTEVAMGEDKWRDNVMDYEIIIPGVPIAQHRPRFARRGKFVATYSDQATEAGKFLLLAKQQIPEVAPQGTPVALECIFYFPWPASITKKSRKAIEERQSVHCKKPDASNCLKFVEDCLNGIAWYDDSQVWLVLCRKYYDNSPRTQLTIRWRE